MNKKTVLLSAILLTAALSACSSRQASPEPSEDPKATVEHMTTDCSAEAPSASGPAEESSSSIPAEVPSDASDRTGRFLKSTSGDGILVIDNYGPVVFTYASGDRSVLDTLDNGDSVSMKAGPIMETWPGQTTVYSCELLRKGRRDAVDPDTLASLMEMGQIAKEPLSPMFYARDTLFISTGRTASPTCGTEDGSFSSVIDSLKVPSENGQSNFGNKGDGYISLWDGAMAVRDGDHYTLFLANGMLEYEGRFFRQSDLSEDTVAWLESYNNLPEEGRKSISYVPYDLMPEDNTGITAMETDASAP